MAGRILVKPGVTFVYHPAGFRILEAVRKVAGTLGINVTITSGADGAHSGPGDPHHTGEAYDLRTHDLTPGAKLDLLRGIQHELGEDQPGRQFFTFLEAAGTPNEHIHTQRRNSTVYSIYDYLNA